VHGILGMQMCPRIDLGTRATIIVTSGVSAAKPTIKEGHPIKIVKTIEMGK